MGSKPGRKTNNWKTQPGILYRCVATQLYRAGYPKAEMVERFKQTVPEYQKHFANPVTDDAIWMRGYLGSKLEYEHEWPDRKAANHWHWETARGLLNRGVFGIVGKDEKTWALQVHAGTPGDSWRLCTLWFDIDYFSESDPIAAE